MSALPPKADIAPNKTLSEFCGGRILTSARTTGAHGLRLAARFLARYLVSSLSGKCRDLVGRWRDSPREKQRREVLSRSLIHCRPCVVFYRLARGLLRHWHDRRKIFTGAAPIALFVDVLLRCRATHAAPRVVWRLIRRHLGYFGDMRTQSVCSAGAGSGRVGRSCHSAAWGVKTQKVLTARLVAVE